MELVALFLFAIGCRGRYTAVFVNFTGRTTDFSCIRILILGDHFSTQGRLALPHYGNGMSVR